MNFILGKVIPQYVTGIMPGIKKANARRIHDLYHNLFELYHTTEMIMVNRFRQEYCTKSILTGREITAATGTGGLVRLLRKVANFKLCNGSERTAVTGMSRLVGWLLKMAISPSSNGRERMAATGIVILAMVLL